MQHYFIFAGINTYKNKLRGHNGEFDASFFEIYPPLSKKKGIATKDRMPRYKKYKLFFMGGVV